MVQKLGSPDQQVAITSITHAGPGLTVIARAESPGTGLQDAVLLTDVVAVPKTQLPVEVEFTSDRPLPSPLTPR